MSAHDYGNCHACGGKVEEKLTDQSLQRSGEWCCPRRPHRRVHPMRRADLSGTSIASLDEVAQRARQQPPQECIQVRCAYSKSSRERETFMPTDYSPARLIRPSPAGSRPL